MLCGQGPDFSYYTTALWKRKGLSKNLPEKEGEGNMEAKQRKLVSWNVNGLRACMGKGFAQFLEEEIGRAHV